MLQSNSNISFKELQSKTTLELIYGNIFQFWWIYVLVFRGRMPLKWLLKMVEKQISTPSVFLNPESEVEYVESCFCPRQMGQWPNPKLPHPAGLQGQTWLGQWRNEEKIHRKARTGWSGFLDWKATDPVNSGWFLDTIEQGGGVITDSWTKRQGLRYTSGQGGEFN